MKTKLSLLILFLAVFALLSAQDTSPGWTYGFELGAVLGDNAGSDESVGPLFKGNVQLQMFPFLMTRFGLGYAHLSAGDIYTNSAVISDLRAIIQPFHGWFSPYVYAGYGAAINVSESMLNTVPYYPVGLGTQFRIKNGMLLDVSLGYNLANSDDLDGRVRPDGDENTYSGRKQDGFYNLSVGLMFYSTPARPVVTPAPAPAVRQPAPTAQRQPAPTPVVAQRPVQPDPNQLDSDGDGLKDVDEINLYGTDPFKADTDGDGLSDYDEIMIYNTDPLKPDTDNDGLNDYDEVMIYKTNPLVADTDRDGLSDGDEVHVYKTDPLHQDTDRGTVDDGTEVAAGTNPLDPRDDVIDLRAGATLVLDGIMFETASAAIRPESLPILEKAYRALAANPDVQIRVVGHTDNVGSAAMNMTLSTRRAESVMAWLVQRGVAAGRMTAFGRGLTQPRATNDTAEGRQLNRRIEFEIVQ